MSNEDNISGVKKKKIKRKETSKTLIEILVQQNDATKLIRGAIKAAESSGNLGRIFNHANLIQPVQEAIQATESSRNIGQIFNHANLMQPVQEAIRATENSRNIGQIFNHANLMQPVQEAILATESSRNLGQIFNHANLMQPIQDALRATESSRNLGQIFMQQYDATKLVRDALKATEGSRNLGQIFNYANLMQPIQDALRATEGSRNSGQMFMEPVEVIESTLSSSFNQMDVVSSKQYYEGLSSVIRETNLDEALIEEDNAINVISDSHFKNVCYRLTLGVLIIALSSTLTDEEIKNIWDFIVGLFTILGPIIPTPVKKEIHHHHHHYHNNDE